MPDPLTPSAIRAMEAGAELDALVARNVMQFTTVEIQPMPRRGETHVGEPIMVCVVAGWKIMGFLPFSPSQDIAAAFEVVEKMLIDGYAYALWHVPGISSIQPQPMAAFRPFTEKKGNADAEA